ncbi:MAG: F0F1 ATP synthase subunit delta [Pseudomonadota bacterium]
MADNDTLARPYAQAIFDVAKDDGTLAKTAAAIQAAAEVVSDDSVSALIGHPKVSDSALLEFLQGTLAEIDAAAPLAAGDGTNLLKLLIDNGRLEVLPEIAAQVDALKLQSEKVVDVTVTSASQVDAAQLDSIRKVLVERLGNDVNIHTTIDEDLIGGAVIRAGDYVIDGSVRGQLARLSTVLAK